MSYINLNYANISEVISSSRNVEAYLINYAENLSTCIIRPLTRLSGNDTSYISSARTRIEEKIKELKRKSGNYRDFYGKLTRFRGEAKDCDTRVSNNFKNVTNNLKEELGISKTKSFWVNLYYEFTNSSALGRFINSIFRGIKDICDSLRRRLKNFYRNQGGETILKMVANTFILVGSIAMLFSGGSFLYLAGALISIANSYNNLIAGSKALDSLYSGDPVWAKRYDNINKFSDTLRLASRFTDKKTSTFLKIAALAFDGVEFVVDLVNLKDSFISIKKLVLKNNTFRKVISKFTKTPLAPLKNPISYTKLTTDLLIDTDKYKNHDIGKFFKDSGKFLLGLKNKDIFKMISGELSIINAAIKIKIPVIKLTLPALTPGVLQSNSISTIIKNMQSSKNIEKAVSYPNFKDFKIKPFVCSIKIKNYNYAYE